MSGNDKRTAQKMTTITNPYARKKTIPVSNNTGYQNSRNDNRIEHTGTVAATRETSTIINPYAKRKIPPSESDYSCGDSSIADPWVSNNTRNQYNPNDKRMAHTTVATSTIINPYAKKNKISTGESAYSCADACKDPFVPNNTEQHQRDVQDVNTIRSSSAAGRAVVEQQTKQGSSIPPLRPQEGFKRTPQSQVLTFGSATIYTVSEVAASREEEEVRVTGRWIRGDGTDTDWLKDPLVTTTDIRIRLRNPVEPCLSERSRGVSINNNTLLTVFGRLADGAITVRLAVVCDDSTMHMGLHQKALMARRRALGQLVEKSEERVDEQVGFAYSDISM